VEDLDSKTGTIKRLTKNVFCCIFLTSLHYCSCNSDLIFSRTVYAFGPVSIWMYVKPVKSGHLWDEPRMSLIRRCHHRVQFALKTGVWDQIVSLFHRTSSICRVDIHSLHCIHKAHEHDQLGKC
jgi:hypothetical protein